MPSFVPSLSHIQAHVSVVRFSTEVVNTVFVDDSGGGGGTGQAVNLAYNHSGVGPGRVGQVCSLSISLFLVPLFGGGRRWGKAADRGMRQETGES